MLQTGTKKIYKKVFLYNPVQNLHCLLVLLFLTFRSPIKFRLLMNFISEVECFLLSVPGVLCTKLQKTAL